MRSLTFEPMIPPPLWLLLATVSIGLLAWYAFHRPASVRASRWWLANSLSFLGLFIVLAILLNPTWLETKPPPAGKPTLTIALDDSGSMETPDGARSKTRFEEAVQIASAASKSLSDYFEVRVQTFAAASTAANLNQLNSHKPEGPATDLASAITEGIQGDRPQGQAMLLLSDGIHNAGGRTADVLAAVKLAKGLDVPIYTRTLGGESGIKDLAIELDSQQELAFLGQNVPIGVRVSQTGLALREATITLSNNDKEIAKQQVKLDAAGQGEAQFLVRQPKTGVYRYEAKVTPFEGEATLVNNFAPFLLRVVDTPVRVLLLEGKPYWDAKFFVRTLTSDPSIELDSLVALAETRLLYRSLGRSTNPVTATAAKNDKKSPPGKQSSSEKSGAAEGAQGVESWRIVASPSELFNQPKFLSKYQIIVLGRSAESYLSDEFIERLRQWVSRENGSLICYRGAPISQVSQQFARMLPVKWQPRSEGRFRVQLTERGRDVRWLAGGRSRTGEILTQLPTLATTANVQEATPLAVVLATTGGASAKDHDPVVTYQPYGEGRVVVIEGSGMWRWAFLPPQYRQHDGIYSAIWQSMLRWLVSSYGLLPGQKLSLRSDRVSFRTSEAAIATLLTREESATKVQPSIELTSDAMDKPKQFTAIPVGDATGTYRITFGKLPEGRYKAKVVGASESDSTAVTVFDVRNLVEEKLHITAKPDLMARIAQESGGKVYEEGSPTKLIDAFREHKLRGRLDQVTRTAAWDRWWVLILASSCWATGWQIRRSSGLV